MAKNTNTAKAIVTNTNTNTEATETQAPVNAPTIDVTALMAEHKSKSAVIRHLAAEGHSRGFIAKTLKAAGVLSEKSAYQHVRNVLTQPLKKAASAA